MSPAPGSTDPLSSLLTDAVKLSSAEISDALDALRKNLATLGATGRADVRAGSVLALGPAPRTYDLLMLDAPYGTGAGGVALDKLGRLGWIGPDSRPTNRVEPPPARSATGAFGPSARCISPA